MCTQQPLLEVVYFTKSYVVFARVAWEHTTTVLVTAARGQTCSWWRQRWANSPLRTEPTPSRSHRVRCSRL